MIPKWRGRLLVGAFACTAWASGCAETGSGDSVLPVGDDGASAESGGPTAGQAIDGTTEPSPSEPGAAGDEVDPHELASEVAELLGDYDAAYAAMAAEPMSAHDHAHPAVLAWHEAAVAGSELDLLVRDQLVLDAGDNRVLYLPDASGLVRVDHALEVTPGEDGGVSWTNCAFTPWVEVDADTGEVLDDRPFQRRGTGRAVRDADGSLLVIELTDDELIELPEGAVDPCVASGDTDGAP